MPLYRFLTEWEIEAPIERVWEALTNIPSWPRWWTYVAEVEELRPGDRLGVGSVQRFHFNTSLPYHLRFSARITRVEPPTCLEGRATGELEGLGRCELETRDGITSVRITWEVRPTKWWMVAVSPVARPYFAWAHELVMARGARGLARYLDTRLAKDPTIRFPFVPLLWLVGGVILVARGLVRRRS
ncbi:MAG: SRPBCC family protein [Acidimicrobiia bacterium]